MNTLTFDQHYESETHRIAVKLLTRNGAEHQEGIMRLILSKLDPSEVELLFERAKSLARAEGVCGFNLEDFDE